LLEAVGHPFAVNADRALRKAALERGWPMLTFSNAGPAAGTPAPAQAGHHAHDRRNRRLPQRVSPGTPLAAAGVASVIVQKAVTSQTSSSYLTRCHDTVSGYVTSLADTVGISTPAELYTVLGLGFSRLAASTRRTVPRRIAASSRPTS